MEQSEPNNLQAEPHVTPPAHYAIHAQHTRKRQFQIYNIFMVVAMGFGSMSYGYSASIIATTLGMQQISGSRSLFCN
jgi:hypothetical protein